MKKFYKNVMFQRLFLACCVVFFFLSVLFSLMVFRQVVDKEQAILMQDTQNRAELLGRLLDEKFTSIDQIGTQLANMSWVNHVRSRSEIMLRSIDMLKRKEICSQISTYQAILRVCNSAALLLPHKDTAIDGVSFWDEDSYLASIGLKGLRMDDLLKSLPDATTSIVPVPLSGTNESSPNFVVLKNLDYASQPELVLFVYISGESLTRLVRQNTGTDLRQFEICYGDAFSITNLVNPVPDAATDQYTIESSLFPWVYHFDMAQHHSVNGLMIMLLICILLGDVVVSILVSFELARIAYAPMDELLQRLGVKSTGTSEMAAIEDVFRSLRQEKQSFELLSRQYYTMAKNNLLIILLNGLFDESVTPDSLRGYGLDLSDDGTYMVALLLYREQMSKEDKLLHYVKLRESFADIPNYLHFVELTDRNIVLVIECEQYDEEMYSRCAGFVREAAERAMPGVLDAYFGMIYHGLIGISKSYQDAKEHAAEDAAPNTATYYYPNDWERQLFTSLSERNRTVAERIVAELRAENESRELMFSDMHTVIQSILYTIIDASGWTQAQCDVARTAFDGAAFQQNADALWAYLSDCVLKVCADNHCTDASTEIGNQIIAYVDKHIFDSELSQQSIASEFGISRPMVSKLFKRANDGNFIDYVHHQRVEEAKRCFEGGNRNMLEVAHLVGYDNEITFKRAFMRCEAVTPRTYCNELDRKGE